MIKLNGKKFAELKSDDSQQGIVGFYRRYKRSIKLFNIKQEHIGTINKWGVLCCATKVNGGTWYNFATIAEVGEYSSYMESVNEPKSYAVHQCASINGDTEYWFK